MNVTVVVPTLNAEDTLAGCLTAVAGHPIIVMDGGSTDGTRALAETYGARVVSTAPGRGRQLRLGAETALRHGADVLLFLHADTILGDSWRHDAADFLGRPEHTRRAAFFTLAFDDPAPQARRIAAAANWRARFMGLPYGDQGLLIGAAFYREIGGYKDLPLMEDVDIARRIGRRRLLPLASKAVTSADRYRRDGWLRRPLRNLACLGLYMVGVPPERLAAFYAGRKTA